MPRLTVVIPVRDSVESFEATLVSVLENRPVDCEVIVVHNGSYSDPFDIGDEVSFVVKPGSTINQICQGIRSAQGDVVHILHDGFTATESWAEAALESFADEDVGCVVPLICDESSADQILAAGWAFDSLRLRRSIAQGAASVGRNESKRVTGPFIGASFWRLHVLQRAIDAMPTKSSLSAESFWTKFTQRCGLEVRLVTQSQVVTQASNLDLQTRGFKAGYQWQVNQSVQSEAGVTRILGAALAGVLASPLSPQAWTTASGRVMAAFFGVEDIAAIRDRLDQAILPGTEEEPVDEPRILQFPKFRVEQTRRAA